MNNTFLPNNENSVVASERILYTPSPFARASLLHLQEIGELKALHPHISSRSNLQSFLFFTVVFGSGDLTYDGKSYRLTQGDCVFIDCERPYSQGTSEDDLWTLRWCHFYGANAPAIYAKYCERGGRPVFRPEDGSRLGEVWKTLFETASGSDHMRDMLINQGLSSLLTLIMSESWHPEDRENLPGKKALLVHVREYLDAHFSDKISLDDLAERFYINKYYLSKSFKEQYGTGINNYLLSVRITRAKQLLRFSNKTVEEIGIECGLGAAHYFSSKFKEIEGVPPSVYREQW